MLKLNLTKTLTVSCGNRDRSLSFGGYIIKKEIVEQLRARGWAIGRKRLCLSCRETPATMRKGKDRSLCKSFDLDGERVFRKTR